MDVALQVRDDRSKAVSGALLFVALRSRQGEFIHQHELVTDRGGVGRLKLTGAEARKVDWEALDLELRVRDRLVPATHGKPKREGRGKLRIDVRATESIDRESPREGDPAGADSKVSQLTLIGQILRSDDRPLAGAKVLLQDGESFKHRRESGAEGQFQLVLNEDQFHSVDWAQVTLQIRHGGKDVEIVERRKPEKLDELRWRLPVVVAIPEERLPDKEPDGQSDPWRIYGRVTDAQLSASEATVRAVAVSLSGEDPVGAPAKTSSTGRYEILYDWKGECPPDLQVTAKAGNKVLAKSPVYFAASRKLRVDLVVGGRELRGVAEFERIENQVLSCNDDFDIKKIGDPEVEYLIGKTRVSRRLLESYLVASRFGVDADVPAEVYYGLFRAGLPTSIEGLVNQTSETLKTALKTSVDKNVVAPQPKDAIANLQSALRQMATVGALAPREETDSAGLSALLDAAKLPKKTQSTVIQRYLEHQGNDAAFWEELRDDASIGKHARRIQLSLQAGALSGYHTPTVSALISAAGKSGAVGSLASWDDSRWLQFEKTLKSAPPNTSGRTKQQKIRTHVEGMKHVVRRSFANEYTTSGILRSDTFKGSPVVRFLQNNPDFDYARSRIGDVLDQAELGAKERPPLEESLNGIQRVYRLAPAGRTFEVVDALQKDGIDSAASIKRQGAAQFVATYRKRLGLAVAVAVFRQARRVAATSAALVTGIREVGAASQIYAIGGGVELSAALSGTELGLPSYADLFGGQSTCACEHCNSVYSPSAYLVDLLEYLGESSVTSSRSLFRPVTGLELLFERRSDIGDIVLDCVNTNTVLPYIDLVNEIFEREVAGKVDATNYQTTWTERELRANPEHRDDDAYRELAVAKYPLSAPFRLWNAEADHYLDHLGTSRTEVIATVKESQGADPASTHTHDYAALGLTGLDVEVLTGTHSSTVREVGELWGYDQSGWRPVLASVPEFLARSGLTYNELRELVTVEYINKPGQLGIDFSEAESTCDIDGAVLRYLENGRFVGTSVTKESFDRIQRFLRLRLRTGWTVFELGRVLAALHVRQINEAVVRRLSVLAQIAQGESLTVLEVAAWWGPIDTAPHPIDETYRPFYEEHFLNPAVLSPPDEALALGGDRSELLTAGDSISEHVSAVAAALQLTEEATSMLAASLVDSTGNPDDSLTLSNLSHLFRVASLCRAVGLEIGEYFILRRLLPGELWDAARPQLLPEFVAASRAAQESEISIAELGYLLLHDPASVAEIELTEMAIGTLLKDIQNTVQGVWLQYERTDAPLVEQLGELLAEFFEAEDRDWILEHTALQRTPAATAELEAHFDFLDLAELRAATLQVAGQTENDRFEALFELLSGFARKEASIDSLAQVVAEAFDVPQSSARTILTGLQRPAGASPPFLIEPLLDPFFVNSGAEKLAAALSLDEFDTAILIIEGRSALNAAEQEDFVTQRMEFLDSVEAVAQLLGPSALASVPERYAFVTEQLDDGAYSFVESVFGGQFEAVRHSQKIAILARSLGIGTPGLEFLNAQAGSVGVQHPTAFPFHELDANVRGFRDWRTLEALLKLRELLRESEDELIGLLGMALDPSLIDTVSQRPQVDVLITGGDWSEADRSLLSWLSDWAEATGRPFEDLAAVAHSDWLDLELADFARAATLVHVDSVASMAQRLGTSANQLRSWSALDLEPEDSASAVQTARGRYELERWYEVAPTLRDPLRELQRDALSDFMLAMHSYGSRAELYNHYLIDSEMSACMLTSRTKLALSSVQLFLQRCLLGLERELVDVMRPDEWDWRKNYRVWEANRKVFLYPENWIEPELRIHRSEIFDEAKGVLLQSEATAEVAEQAALRYLDGLDEVSNVEVLGSYKQATPDRLHVVGRTRATPRNYFYRLREGNAWLPWQEIDVDLDAEQVLPTVINSRLFLFWPTFLSRQAKVTDHYDAVAIEEMIDDWAKGELWDAYLDYLLHYNRGSAIAPESLDEDYASIEEWVDDMRNTTWPTVTLDAAIADLVGEGAMSFEGYTYAEQSEARSTLSQASVDYFEIGLSYCEYKGGGWLPAKQSTETIASDTRRTVIALLSENLPPATPSDLHFYASVSGDMATIECVQSMRYLDGTTYRFEEGHFTFDALSKQTTASDAKEDVGWADLFLMLFGIVPERTLTEPTGADVFGNAFIEKELAALEIPEIEEGETTSFIALLEQTPGSYRVPLQHQNDEFDSMQPFFYSDSSHCYVVTSKAGTPIATFGTPIDNRLDAYVASQAPSVGAFPSLTAGAPIQIEGVTKVAAEAPRTLMGSTEAVALQAGTSDISASGFEAKTTLGDALVVDQFFQLWPNNYRFDSLHHPLVGELIRTVNGESLEFAFARDLQQTVEEYFDGEYGPTTAVSSVHPNRSFAFVDSDPNGFYNWEFFFHLPLLVASRLSKNQQFGEAQKWLHLIFDPRASDGGAGAERFWQFAPFFNLYSQGTGHPTDSIADGLRALSADPATADDETLALKEQTEQQIETWLANPFDPHAIAALRPVAYMKATVMKYLENLIAWGDHLYAQFTHEAISEATQYYLLAYQILGERPLEVPAIEVVAKSFNELGVTDEFSNAVAQIENLISLPTGSTLGSGTQPLYFCIPNNPNLLQYWDTVEDRLFKIRHCMTLDGEVRQLPLFQPPIDPALLVRATAAGVDIGSALASLSMPAPHYRGRFLLAKAAEYCASVKNLGSQLLSALEKQDGETLSLLRAEHEEVLLDEDREVRDLRVEEAYENLTAAEKSKTLVEERIEYYERLEKRSEKENESLRHQNEAERKRDKAASKEKLAGKMNYIPNVSIGIAPVPSVGTSFGGSNIGAAFSAKASSFRNESALASHKAGKATTDASHDRRWDDWKLQERLARKELKQVEDQIVAAELRVAIAEKERDNHATRRDQAREVRDTMVRKFTNADLYGWTASQVSSIYFQSYQLAYELAKRAEKAVQRELGEYDSSFIAFGYWDSLKKGLMSGERLHHDLQRLESHYIDANRREHELTKHISLSQLDPRALLELKAGGTCFFSLPEVLFDLDHPQHYFRRIKSVSLSLPSIAGPYTSVSSTLTLMSDGVRTTPQVAQDEADEAFWRTSLGAMDSIATSSGQSDGGTFQLDFRDERYLPFEGAGAVSDWKLSLGSPELAQFNFSTISDVIIHLSYTARDGGDSFAASVSDNALQKLNHVVTPDAGFPQVTSLRDRFPTAWAALMDADATSEFLFDFELDATIFPYLLRNHISTVGGIQVFAIPRDGVTGSLGAVGMPSASIAPAAFDTSDSSLPPKAVFPTSASAPLGGHQLSLDVPFLGARDQIKDLLFLCSAPIAEPVN